MGCNFNAKKSKLKRRDFDKLGQTLGIPERSIAHAYAKIDFTIELAEKFIMQSFLPEKEKKKYCEIIDRNWKMLS